MTAHATCDIAISGGGIAGLTAAAAFGAAGFHTICVDPQPPVTEEADPASDLRTTALLDPSIRLLEEIGLWPRLAPHAAALRVMRIVDAGGHSAAPRRVLDFEARELSDRPFGFNLPNWLLRRELLAHLAGLPGVELRPGIAATRLFTREGGARLSLSDGGTITAPLLVAADGRDSPMREALGITARTWTYGQKALAFAVSHPVPHRDISTEIHRSGGPFTLVPLPDRNGRPASAVIWMERGPQALRLAALPPAEFEAAMTARSGAILGPLTLITQRRVWPIITRVAARMTGERGALMAEAAHVVPPIGAQGLNMSLADLRVLRDLAVAAPGAIGTAPMLAGYERQRHREVMARARAIDLLNRASMAGLPPARNLRAALAVLLHAAPPLRRAMMRAGLGATGGRW